MDAGVRRFKQEQGAFNRNGILVIIEGNYNNQRFFGCRSLI